MAFTSWTQLHSDLLDRLADFAAGKAFIASSVSVNTGAGSRDISYRNISELKAAIDIARTMAAYETGAAVGRTHAVSARHR